MVTVVLRTPPVFLVVTTIGVLYVVVVIVFFGGAFVVTRDTFPPVRFVVAVRFVVFGLVVVVDFLVMGRRKVVLLGAVVVVVLMFCILIVCVPVELRSSIMSTRFWKLPCRDSKILLTKVPILFLSKESSTKPGVDISTSLVTALEVADIFKFGFRTGGKLIKSFGEEYDSSSSLKGPTLSLPVM